MLIYSLILLVYEVHRYISHTFQIYRYTCNLYTQAIYNVCIYITMYTETQILKYYTHITYTHTYTHKITGSLRKNLKTRLGFIAYFTIMPGLAHLTAP